MKLVYLGVMMALGLGSTAAQAIEKPKYDVVRSVESDGNDIEIRAYAPMLVAETSEGAQELTYRRDTAPEQLGREGGAVLRLDGLPADGGGAPRGAGRVGFRRALAR